MNIKIKHFNELTTLELYRILQVRAEVFIIEQSCFYQDLDGKDRDALHLWLEEDGKVLAYVRNLKPGVSFKEAAIGRVITTVRSQGYGLQIMQIAIQEHLHSGFNKIRISAQAYAREFYEKCGFQKASDEYLEDGIPHIQMLWERS